MKASKYIEMSKCLKDNGYSEKDVAEFNRVTVLEYRLLLSRANETARKLKKNK